MIKRIWEHKESLVDGFTKKYHVKNLVDYEPHHSAGTTILREKKLKKWSRQWKRELIEKFNSGWKDLYDDIIN